MLVPRIQGAIDPQHSGGCEPAVGTDHHVGGAVEERDDRIDRRRRITLAKQCQGAGNVGCGLRGARLDLGATAGARGRDALAGREQRELRRPIRERRRHVRRSDRADTHDARHARGIGEVGRRAAVARRGDDRNAHRSQTLRCLLDGIVRNYFVYRALR